jgi:hypothetical protein
MTEEIYPRYHHLLVSARYYVGVLFEIMKPCAAQLTAPKTAFDYLTRQPFVTARTQPRGGINIYFIPVIIRLMVFYGAKQ